MLAMTRAIAMKRGEKFYMAVRPCRKAGHVVRRTSTKDCIACAAERASEHYRENREEYIKRNTLWNAKNPRRHAIHVVSWQQRNRKRVLEIAKAVRDRSPEKKSAHDRNRRARKSGAAGRHTAADIADLHVEQEGKCFWCLVPYGTSFHIDHIIPLARGGSNYRDNIVVSCPSCNLSRRHSLPFAFLRETM